MRLTLLPLPRHLGPHHVQAHHLPHLVQAGVHPHQVPVGRLVGGSYAGRALDTIHHLPHHQTQRVDVSLLERFKVGFDDGAVQHLRSQVPLGAHLAVERQIQTVGAGVVADSEAQVTNSTGQTCSSGVNGAPRDQDVLTLEVSVSDGWLALGALDLKMKMSQTSRNIKTNLDSLDTKKKSIKNISL